MRIFVYAIQLRKASELSMAISSEYALEYGEGLTKACSPLVVGVLSTVPRQVLEVRYNWFLVLAAYLEAQYKTSGHF